MQKSQGVTLSQAFATIVHFLAREPQKVEREAKAQLDRCIYEKEKDQDIVAAGLLMLAATMELTGRRPQAKELTAFSRYKPAVPEWVLSVETRQSARNLRKQNFTGSAGYYPFAEVQRRHVFEHSHTAINAKVMQFTDDPIEQFSIVDLIEALNRRLDAEPHFFWRAVYATIGEKLREEFEFEKDLKCSYRDIIDQLKKIEAAKTLAVSGKTGQK